MFNDSPTGDVAIDADYDDVSYAHAPRLGDVSVIRVIDANGVVVAFVG